MKRLAMRGLLLCLLAVESSYAPPSHPQLLQQYAFHKVFRVDVQQGQEPASARLYFGKQQFPKELKPQYNDLKKLGVGFVGVTFLATRRADNETVAVKLLTFEEDHYFTARDCSLNEKLMRSVRIVAEECQAMQAIQSLEAQRPEQARHVGKCYYDGITPELEHPGGILAQSTRPLYLELRYEGSVTVDQWWIQLQRRAPEASEVVAAVKFIGSELLKALAFLSERPEPRFVHHDLRPENFVYNEEKHIVVLIDFGDVTSNATVKRGGRRLYRPPEVGGANYGPYLTEVGWSPPAWSYDVFSAGTFLLALGADPLPQDSMNIFPSMTYFSRFLMPPKLATLPNLKVAATCAGGQAEPWADCLLSHLPTAMSEVHRERLDAVRATPRGSEERRSALASLVACRSFVVRGDVSDHWPEVPYGRANGSFGGEGRPWATRATPHLWRLLENWMRSGFDETLLAMVDADPAKRPTPSTVLASDWFGQDCADCAGSEAEMHCPEIPRSEVGVLHRNAWWGFSLAALAAIFLAASGLGAYFKILTAPSWTWCMPLAGLVTLAMPWVFFYAMEWPYLWALCLTASGLLRFWPASSHRLLLLALAGSVLVLRALFDIMNLKLLGPYKHDPVVKQAFDALFLELLVCFLVLAADVLTAAALRPPPKAE